MSNLENYMKQQAIFCEQNDSISKNLYLMMCSAPMIKMLGMELQILKMFGASVWYQYSHA